MLTKDYEFDNIHADNFPEHHFLRIKKAKNISKGLGCFTIQFWKGLGMSVFSVFDRRFEGHLSKVAGGG